MDTNKTQSTPTQKQTKTESSNTHQDEQHQESSDPRDEVIIDKVTPSSMEESKTLKDDAVNKVLTGYLISNGATILICLAIIWLTFRSLLSLTSDGVELQRLVNLFSAPSEVSTAASPSENMASIKKITDVTQDAELNIKNLSEDISLIQKHESALLSAINILQEEQINWNMKASRLNAIRLEIDRVAPYKESRIEESLFVTRSSSMGTETAETSASVPYDRNYLLIYKPTVSKQRVQLEQTETTAVVVEASQSTYSTIEFLTRNREINENNLPNMLNLELDATRTLLKEWQLKLNSAEQAYYKELNEVLLTYAYDPWEDALQAVRYLALITMIYAIFFKALNVIHRKVVLSDSFMVMRIQNIYLGSDEEIRKQFSNLNNVLSDAEKVSQNQSSLMNSLLKPVRSWWPGQSKKAA
ncbi:MAG: hypothetical protein ACFHVJ_15880 [Aestuariibacter sp.]